jgi:hypothetical protein
MSAMKISLDAAMRARDVSAGWRDETHQASAGPPGTDTPRGEPAPGEPAPGEPAPRELTQPDIGDHRHRPDGLRRRRRTRLQHGQPS